MNTTAAATQAGVTIATIRTWCRRGVIAATKTAGRWIIDAASLAHRITIGQYKAHKEANMIDLTATYTFTHAGASEPTTVTPTIKRRATTYAGNTITITGLIPLFADHFDAITDEGSRLHALTIFNAARIVITDRFDADWEGDPQARDGGQLRTTYRGEIPGLSASDVLDIAQQIRTQIGE